MQSRQAPRREAVESEKSEGRVSDEEDRREKGRAMLQCVISLVEPGKMADETDNDNRSYRRS